MKRKRAKMVSWWLESLPFHVPHLTCEPAALTAREERADADDDSADSHYEKHIETAQCVNRQQSSIAEIRLFFFHIFDYFRLFSKR